MTQLTTKEFAEMMKVTSSYVRYRLAVTGSFYGMVPTKLVNGKHVWDKEAAQELLTRYKP